MRQEDIGVDQGFRFEFAVLRANHLEVVTDLNQAIHVQVGGVAGAFQHFHEGFRGVVTWAKRQRGNGSIDHIGAGFDGLHKRD